MLLRRFYDTGLAQASYLIGCQATGDAIVIDANRDLAPYLETAAAEKVRITHVTETHIHADYVSGSRELAARTKAQLLLSAEGGAEWQYGFAATDGATLLHDGDVIRVGNIHLTVMHTPGHTPEHLSFLVTDTAGATEPMGIVSGDFVFVGDVGRPDLLEKAAKQVGTMEAGARTLWRSLERFRALPDYLQVWPGHGAGSACGKALGAVPTSTVGYEKRFNWGVGASDEASFIAGVLDGQPDPPRYFAQMKRINRDGPPMIGEFHAPSKMSAEELSAAIGAGAQLVDVRPAADFAGAPIEGALNIPLNASFSTWAGWLLAYDRPILLVADAGTALRVVRELAMIGLDQVAGRVDATDALRTRAAAPIAQLQAAALASRDPSAHLIDVRNDAEWSAGHIAGAEHRPLGHLDESLATLPRDTTILVHCQSGARSAIAASLLRLHGFQDVVNVQGGWNAYVAAGLPVTR